MVSDMDETLLAQFPVYRVTMNDGRVYTCRFLSTLVTRLHQAGVKVNRTAIYRALYPRRRKEAGQYRDMRIERITLNKLGARPMGSPLAHVVQ